MARVATHHVVFFSGGASSWAAGKRVAEWYGPENVTLLFTDTLIEDEDLYRFLEEAAADIGVPITKLADGRDPWKVFRDVRMIGNSRIDPCSKILKRDLAWKWVAKNCHPDTHDLHFGYDPFEVDRLEGTKRARPEWTIRAPLAESPMLFRGDIFKSLEDQGIAVPRLYTLGFAHNNCGGFCVKAGHGHFATLLEQLPDRYRYHEEKEEEMRQFLRKDVAIMRDRTGGRTRPLTLREFRRRKEQGAEVDRSDIGGCDCFSAPEEVV